MAYWQGRMRTEILNQTFENGINTNLTTIKRSECVSNSNTSSHKYPALSSRRGRLKYATALSSTCYAVGYRYDLGDDEFHLHVVDNTTWKYWTGSAWSTVATVSAVKGNFINFNTSTANNIIFANDTQIKSFDGSFIQTHTTLPLTRHYTVDDRRLYALKSNKIYFSAGGSITDWSSALDAGSVSVVGSRGTEKALCTYKDTVIAFYDDSMHILYGDDVDNYELSDPIEIGCISDRAIVEHGGLLYFVYKDGLYRYDGGLPTKISYKIQTYFDDLAASDYEIVSIGKHDRFLYLHMKISSSYMTFEYDTLFDVWNLHDTRYIGFTNVGPKLIGVDDSNGKVWSINGYNEGYDYETSESVLTCDWTSGWIDYGAISKKKKVTKMYFLVYVSNDGDSSLKLYLNTDNSGTLFILFKTFPTANIEQIVKVDFGINYARNIDRYKLKFIGKGNFYIRQVDEYFRVKGRY